MGRGTTILILLLVLIVGGMFYFSSQAEPVPQQTIEQPVDMPSDAGDDAE